MHQNVTIAEAVVALVLRLRRPAPPDRLRGGQLPLGALPLPGPATGADVVVGGRRRGRRRGDRRADAARPGHARALQDRRDPGRRGDRRRGRTRHGALVVLDAYQSVGTVPLDVTALGVDFAVGGSVKWLCGGPGAAWLYVRPDLAGDARAGAHRLAGPRAAVRTSSPSRTTRRAPARFLTGTPNVPALYAATAGYDVIEEVGVERIRARSLEQTTLLIELLDGAGLRGRQPARPGAPRRHGRRAGARASSAVCRELAARGMICDCRPDVGLRLGPHFFNTDDELALTRSSRSPSSPVRARACGRRSASASRSATRDSIPRSRSSARKRSSSNHGLPALRGEALEQRLDLAARDARRRGGRTRSGEPRSPSYFGISYSRIRWSRKVFQVSSATSRWSWCRSEPWWVRTRSGETLAFSPSKYSFTSRPIREEASSEVLDLDSVVAAPQERPRSAAPPRRGRPRR